MSDTQSGTLIEKPRQSIEFSDTDIAVREVEVKLGGNTFLLREASEDAAGKFANMRTQGAELSKDGRLIKFPDTSRLQACLVSLCLWETNEEGKPTKQVAEDRVRKWPGRVVKQLFEKAKEISDLDEGEKAERKALLSALAREDAPVSRETLQEWLKKINDEDDQYKILYELVEPDKEAAKN